MAKNMVVYTAENMKKEITNKESLKVMKSFFNWQGKNLVILQGKKESDLNNCFGLPYVSSGAYAGFWNTNTESYHVEDRLLNFDGIGMAENGKAIAFFTRLDKSGNEIENIFMPMN